MRSWRDVPMNDSQSSKACGKDEEWIKKNNSYNPIYLLPDDPFEMNKVSENETDRRIFGEFESWIGRSTGDCTVRGGVPIVDSGYQRRKPLLSSFETQVNYGDDFNNIGSSGLVIDVTGLEREIAEINSLELSRHLIEAAEDFEEPLFLEEPPNLHFLRDGPDNCRENCAYVERCAEDFEKLSLIGILLNKPPELHFLHDEICRCKETDLVRKSRAWVERCVACGKCIENCEDIETFVFENICLDFTNSTNKV